MDGAQVVGRAASDYPAPPAFEAWGWDGFAGLAGPDYPALPAFEAWAGLGFGVRRLPVVAARPAAVSSIAGRAGEVGPVPEAGRVEAAGPVGRAAGARGAGPVERAAGPGQMAYGHVVSIDAPYHAPNTPAPAMHTPAVRGCAAASARAGGSRKITAGTSIRSLQW